MSKLYPCKPTITQMEYLQLIGLLTLAAQHVEAQKQLEKAVAELIGQEGDRGHAQDAVWSPYTADELLEKMEIKVVRPKKKAKRVHS